MADKHDRSKPHRHALPLLPSGSELIPTSNRKAVQSRTADRFVSVKAAAPIPARHPALQDALIQASLDPAVRSIGYIATAAVASKQIDLCAIVVQRDEGRFFLDVVPARPIRDLEDEGLSLIALGELGLKPWIISGPDLLREPRCTNARYVWLYNRHRVSRETRRRILRALHKRSMQLGELERHVRSDRDPSADVMALVCAGELELDLTSRPIQLTTIVKSRMR